MSKILNILENKGVDMALSLMMREAKLESKWRLFSIWCASHVKHLMLDNRSLLALRTASSFLEGKSNRDDMELAWQNASEAAYGAPHGMALSLEAHQYAKISASCCVMPIPNPEGLDESEQSYPVSSQYARLALAKWAFASSPSQRERSALYRCFYDQVFSHQSDCLKEFLETGELSERRVIYYDYSSNPRKVTSSYQRTES